MMPPEPPTPPTPEHVKKVLFENRLPMRHEQAMQAAIFARLATLGFEIEHEVTLPGDAGRIDFTLKSSIGLLGIECKTVASANALARQLGRYGRTNLFAALVVITSRPVSLPLSFIQSQGQEIPILVWTVPAL